MIIEDAVNSVPEQAATPDIGAQTETVSVADLFTPEANGAAESSTQAQTDASVSPQKEQRMFTSDEMSKAVQNRLKQERRGAAYQLGRELLDERMRAENLSEADALAKIREDRIKAKAQQYKENPEAAFEELLRNKYQPPTEPEETPTPERNVQKVYNEIVAEINDGKVPEGFDLTAYLSDRDRAVEFLEWREKLGMEQACAIAMRLSDKAPTQTEINRALPKPIGTNNAYSPKQVDFTEMSSEDFRKMNEKIKRMSAAGKRVEF